MGTRWKSLLLALAAALTVAAVTLAVLFWALPLTEEPEEEPIKSQFVIGNWNGQVAVFAGEDPIPMQVLDTFISTLPEDARLEVMAGIPVESADRLSVLLEDYAG